MPQASETMTRSSSKRKKKTKTASSTGIPTPLFVGLVAAAVGAVWYLRRKKDDGSKGSKRGGGATGNKGSAFKFPDGKTGHGRNGGKLAAPKGKKAKSKAKKAEKAEKAKARATNGKQQQQTQKRTAGEGGGDSQQASTSVINYTYFDSARRDTLIPIHKKKPLTAADIIDKDAEARQRAQKK